MYFFTKAKGKSVEIGNTTKSVSAVTLVAAPFEKKKRKKDRVSAPASSFVSTVSRGR
jgi:hypothetical protein